MESKQDKPKKLTTKQQVLKAISKIACVCTSEIYTSDLLREDLAFVYKQVQLLVDELEYNLDISLVEYLDDITPEVTVQCIITLCEREVLKSKW